MKLKCLLGIHNNKEKVEWIPSIKAKIVKEHKHKIWCQDCGKVLLDSHLIWNGQEMIEVNNT